MNIALFDLLLEHGVKYMTKSDIVGSFTKPNFDLCIGLLYLDEDSQVVCGKIGQGWQGWPCL